MLSLASQEPAFIWLIYREKQESTRSCIHTLKGNLQSQEWWLRPLKPALETRQENYKSEVNWTTKWKPISKRLTRAGKVGHRERKKACHTTLLAWVQAQQPTRRETNSSKSSDLNTYTLARAPTYTHTILTPKNQNQKKFIGKRYVSFLLL